MSMSCSRHRVNSASVSPWCDTECPRTTALRRPSLSTSSSTSSGSSMPSRTDRQRLSVAPSSKRTTYSLPSPFFTTTPSRALVTKLLCTICTLSPVDSGLPRISSGTSLSGISLLLFSSVLPSLFSLLNRSSSMSCQTSNSSWFLISISLICSSPATSKSMLAMSSIMSPSSSFCLTTSCASLDVAPTLKTPPSIARSPMRRRAFARLSIRSSTVDGVTSLMTRVCFFWPMRLIRALACSSIIGFQSES
mmetsp:Transcript_38527/g.98492  ORF Transcript_38527/g.98492 Transcript_38527/m.98492 type:complete len:249 (+) Transcript_38527:152-898(+)